jgi:outer membrane biogenesis lipoprotein LolB
MKKFVILAVVGLFLTGCAYSTSLKVGDYGASAHMSVSAHDSL